MNMSLIGEFQELSIDKHYDLYKVTLILLITYIYIYIIHMQCMLNDRI